MEVRRQQSAKGMKLAPSSSSSSSSCSITNLPSPILMEILCRLPIKTLTASKSVCKSWLNLSGDPHFAQLHQARAPTEVCFELSHERDTVKLHLGNFHCLNNFDPRDVKLNTLFEIPKFSVRSSNTLNYGTVIGELAFNNSCNGLLCYYGEGGDRNRFVMIWNPCTSEFITIPTLAAIDTYCCFYGLGFSGMANKFKLLRLTRQNSNGNIVAEILPIEKGCSWSTLGPCPYVWEVIEFYSLMHDPTFLHGTLHWADINDIDGTNDNNDDIITFDFEDEQFGRVPLPPSLGKKKTSKICRVGELLGCLFITECTGECINIWLMKEYGVQDSWTKMYSLPCIVKGERINEDRFLPVTFMDNGEILLVCPRANSYSTVVFSYNPDLEDFRSVGSCPNSLGVIAYRPNLVLLKDSMLGYEVHVNDLKHGEMSTSPDWWTPLTKGEKRKGRVRATSESSVLPNVSAMMEDTMERIKNMREEVVGKQGKEQRAYLEEFEEKMRNELVKVFDPFKEQMEKLKQQNRQLEERLQDEKAKVEQTKEQIQQSEQLKQQNQQLEERLKNEHAKVKLLEEKLQQREQLKEES